MSDPERPKRPETETLPPGADRFWGQFSQTKAGRSHTTEEAGAATDGPEQPKDEGQHCLEWCPICRSADIVRATTSPETFGQVQAIQAEAISVLKSFLAIYAERTSDQGAATQDSEPPPHTGPEVRDISID
jgi:hypothetical protein